MIYAKYTIVLKTLLDDPESKALIDKAMSTYPLYDAENKAKFTQVMSREELNKKILDHFKYREIGFETFGRFLDELEIALNEIMPYYNQKFISEDIINGLKDIFGNLNVTETFEESRSGSSEVNSEGSESRTSTNSSEGESSSNTSSTDNSEVETSMNDSSKSVKTTTPDNNALKITDANIESVPYADEVNFNKGNSSSTSSNSGTATSTNEATNKSSGESTESGSRSDNTSSTNEGTTQHTLHREGNQGVNTYAHDMLEFRGLFLNIVQEIIKDPRIQELFMGVY